MIRVVMVLLLLMSFLFGAITTAPIATAQSDTRCFGETGHCISGSIRQYWERNGGLRVFGFPKSAAQQELVEGRMLTVQWFERDRLEIQPNGDISAGRLGVRMLELLNAPWQFGGNQPAVKNCVTFAQTGYRICDAFASFWQKNGGLGRFGYPITGAFPTVINGQSVTVQYFERRRFELHGGNTVMLGLLGNEIQTLQQQAPPLVYATPATATQPIISRNGQLAIGDKPFEVRGVNYIYTTGEDPVICHAIQFGADGRCPWNMTNINADLDRFKAHGVNTLRVFLNYYVFGGSIPVYTAKGKGAALVHFEEFVAAANARGIYVLPVLLAKFPQNKFSAANYAHFINVHINPLVSSFVGHPGILAWDLFNEPDIGSPIDLRCWDWDNADYPGCFPLAEERQYFIATIAQAVAAADPTHLRTVSLAFAKSHAKPSNTRLRIADMVDFFSFHYYDDSPYDSGRYKAHWYYGQGFPSDLYRSISEIQALGLGKPIVVTEIGFVTDGADATHTPAQLARDLQAARDLSRSMGASGMMIWPFQSSFDSMLGDLYPGR